jgi:hypothetical protein
MIFIARIILAILRVGELCVLPMDPEIEILELLRATCAALRIGKKRPELWEVAARKERELMAEIAKLKSEKEPLLQPVEVGGGR